MALSIRTMNAQDLVEVDRIQREAYDPRLWERVAVFEQKLKHFPEGCWICEADTIVLGYMFSHPSRLAAPPALNQFFGPNAEKEDCYFIHDVAVQPSSRSMGVGCQLADQALRIAAERGFTTIALVSIQNSQGYWQRLGFQPLTEFEAAIRSIKESYGDAACYMGRRLG